MANGSLAVGMAVGDLIALLGPPSSKLGGAALLGMLGSVVGSPGAIGGSAGKEYWVYQRPEGAYQLVIEGGRLVGIHSAPGQ